MDTYRVYLVDDEPWALVYLEKIVKWEDLGFRITGKFENSMEAFNQAVSDPPDVIFIDIRMPEMDGYEACRQIRGAGRRDSLTIPIVAMTANAFSEDIELAGKSGMNAHLAKPVDAEQMISLLKEVLAGEKNG